MIYTKDGRKSKREVRTRGLDLRLGDGGDGIDHVGPPVRRGPRRNIGFPTSTLTPSGALLEQSASSCSACRSAAWKKLQYRLWSYGWRSEAR
jgi:hypothetical protein